VISSFALALALVVWSFLFKQYSKLDVQEESSPMLSKALMTSMTLAVVGMVLLIIQFAIGPIGTG